MDISRQSEIFLREVGYETWIWSNRSCAVTCFENAMLIGFVHAFSSAEDLLKDWESSQYIVLSSHSAQLRAAGEKAWNVYSVFLAENGTQSEQREVERIEENFSLTRKIARINVRTQDDVRHAFLPLTTVKSQGLPSNADFESRLRSRLKDIPENTLGAFLGRGSADEVARMLVENS